MLRREGPGTAVTVRGVADFEGVDVTDRTRGAIETRYAGCRFRSRLEARWAVFFDAMGIRWEYEPQGFMVGDRPYLPDFRLKATGTWVEVKGDESSLDKSLMLAAPRALPRILGPWRPRSSELLILGPIPRRWTGGYSNWAWIKLTWFGHEDLDELDYIEDSHYSFISDYDGTKPLGWARTSTATAVTSGGPWLEPTGDMHNGAFEAKAARAYDLARQARFEHGETPR